MASLTTEAMRAAEALAFVMDAKALSPETIEKAYRAAVLLQSVEDNGSDELSAMTDMIYAFARHHPLFKILKVSP